MRVPTTVLMAMALAMTGCGSSHDRVDSGGGTDAGGRSDAGGGTDAGGGDGWWTCTTNLQCMVAPESCCGACGVATPSDMVGVNRERLTEQRSEACADPIACPECAAPEDPYLVGTCDGSRCGAVDIRAEGLTACSAPADCVLATSRCCDCGVHTVRTAIAINSSSFGRLSELTCEPSTPCPPCVPSFDGLAATCMAGMCTVVETPTGG